MAKHTKNILIAGVGLIVIGGGWFMWQLRSSGEPEPLPELALEDIEIADLSSAPLEQRSLPEITFGGDYAYDFTFESDPDAGETLTVPEPSVTAPTATGLDTFTFDFSGMQDMAPPAQPQPPAPPEGQEGSETPPDTYEPTAAECAQFASAPSCDYVPAHVQDLCRQCK